MFNGNLGIAGAPLGGIAERDEMTSTAWRANLFIR